MTTGIHNIYKVFFLAILLVFACSNAQVQAQEDKITSLLKCLNIARTNPSKLDTIAVSFIKQENFDAEKIKNVELSNIDCKSFSKEHNFHLTSGNALFNPKTDILVQTDLAKVFIGSGSTVCILKPEPGVVSVYNLHSGNNRKVIVYVGDQPITLAAGIEITVCYQSNDFTAINPAPQIAYRTLQSRKLSDGLYIYSTQFSIASAIAHISSLKTMLCSNAKEEQKLVDQLIKDFVILESFLDTDEPYSIAKDSVLKQFSVAKKPVVTDTEHLVQNPPTIAPQ